jgi:ferredoxin
MARKPVVDQEACIGCEACTRICPKVFRMEETGAGHHEHKSFVHDPFGDTEEKIEEAMDNCPVACIHWQEE